MEDAPCSQCARPAVIAVRSARTASRGLRTTVYYDLKDAPHGSEAKCAEHGRDLLDGLIAALAGV